MDDFVALFMILIVPAIPIGLAIWGWRAASKRSRILLDHWILDNGYTLVSYKTALFKKGPYWKASRGQRVLRVIVLDENEIEHNGWVLCGSTFKGVLLSDDVVGILDPIQPG